MTTKTLSTYISGGYVLAAQYDELDITTTGGVGGNGGAALLLDHAATVSNMGAISNLEFLAVTVWRPPRRPRSPTARPP